ncbi:unnamed protein product [Prunus brigantina]
MVFGDCTCESEDTKHNKEAAFKYKLGSIASILVASAVGVSLPLLGKKIPILRPENDIFFMIKAFAAGVILATGFIHILPDAFDNLTSPCLKENPWGNFPFTGFVAMLSAIGTLMVDSLATRGYQSPEKIKPLMVALSFHQFFEGMGLGGCISQSSSTAIMATFFSLTTPVGIAIGIGISTGYNGNCPTALIVEWIFNAAAAGILIYMALVDLLAADFMNPRMQSNMRIQSGAYISLLLGPREANKVVHALAQLALNLESSFYWLEEAIWLDSLLQDDMDVSSEFYTAFQSKKEKLHIYLSGMVKVMNRET